MKKRILAVLCGLLLCISLVGLALAGAAKATLLNEESAARAMEESGFVAGRTALIQQTVRGFFDEAGLDGEVAAEVVEEDAVREALRYNLHSLLENSVMFMLADTEGMFDAVGEGFIAELEADGSTVTEEGLVQMEVLRTHSEGTFSELTVPPMTGVIRGLSGLLGAGSGVASIILCAALAVLAVCGVAWAARGERAAGLYLGSGLLGAGLAIAVPAFVLNSRLAGLTEVMRRYYAPFYSILLAVGAALALVGLVIVVVRLVLGRKAA